MKKHGKFLLLLIVIWGVMAPGGLRAQTFEEEDIDKGLDDIQLLIDATLPMIDSLLTMGQNDYLGITVMMADGSIAEVDVDLPPEAGNDPEARLALVQEELSLGALKGEYRAVALFYDGRAIDAASGTERSAVIVWAEHTSDDFAYRFSYPYWRDAKGDIEYGEGSGEVMEQIMYKP